MHVIRNPVSLFSHIVHDKIIYFWCLGVLNIRFNIFHCTQYFDQNFGRLIDLKTQQY